MSLWTVLVGAAAALLGLWLVLVVLLIIARPSSAALGEALRLLPDTVRLLRRLAADRSLPKAVRARLWFLLAYLAMPIDLIPDFIPIIGHADDVIIAILVLRSVARSAGTEVLRRHWPGTEAGLAALYRLVGIRNSLPA